MIICGALAFLTFGIQIALCKQTFDRTSFDAPPNADAWAIHGNWYTYDATFLRSRHPASIAVVEGFKTKSRDISELFLKSFPAPSCEASLGKVAPLSDNCQVGNDGPDHCHNGALENADAQSLDRFVTYEWADLTPERGHFVVYNGLVLNLRSYIKANNSFLGAGFDDIIQKHRGKDITRAVHKDAEALTRIKCASEIYLTGYMSKQTNGCFTVNVINYISLVIILGLVFTRFFMAVIYSSFVAPRLIKPPTELPYIPPGMEKSFLNAKEAQPKNKRYNGPMTLTVDKRRSVLPTRSRFSTMNRASMYEEGTLASLPSSKDSVHSSDYQCGDPFTPYVMMMVTCYSEGEKGIRSTLESLAATRYNDRNKLFVIVADGLVDSGEKDAQGRSLTTAEICVKLLRLNGANQDPEPKAYVAVAEGSKQLNMAKVVCDLLGPARSHFYIL